MFLSRKVIWNTHTHLTPVLQCINLSFENRFNFSLRLNDSKHRISPPLSLDDGARLNLFFLQEVRNVELVEQKDVTVL